MTFFFTKIQMEDIFRHQIIKRIFLTFFREKTLNRYLLSLLMCCKWLFINSSHTFYLSSTGYSVKIFIIDINYSIASWCVVFTSTSLELKIVSWLIYMLKQCLMIYLLICCKWFFINSFFSDVAHSATSQWQCLIIFICLILWDLHSSGIC